MYDLLNNRSDYIMYVQIKIPGLNKDEINVGFAVSLSQQREQPTCVECMREQGIKYFYP